MIVGCYDLRLYCDGVGCPHGEDGFPRTAEFTGDETGAQARERARNKGWRILANGRCLCPGCNAAKAAVLDT